MRFEGKRPSCFHKTRIRRLLALHSGSWFGVVVSRNMWFCQVRAERLEFIAQVRRAMSGAVLLDSAVPGLHHLFYPAGGHGRF
jgi:hypothetical protein